MPEERATRVVESREVYASNVFRVREDVIELRGRRVSRKIIVHPGAVAALPILPDGRAVMVRQYRHGLGERLLEYPAGTLEPGEAPEACAAREMEEEAGYRAGRIIKLGPYYPSPGICTEIIHLFAATELVKTQSHLEPDEDIELEFHGFDEIVQMIRDGRIRDGKTIAATAMWLWGKGER